MVEPTGLSDAELVVSPPLLEEDVVPVSLNQEFGSYEALIEVPEEADLVEYSIQFRAARSRQGNASNRRYFGDRQSFTVGDPRLPTVELSVDAPFWVTPTGEVQLQVTVVSFIGSAVGGQEISVSWDIGGFDVYPEYEIESEPLEGELIITTDDSGNGQGVIDLSELETPPSIGSTLSVNFQLVGPTGELIEESATVRIEAADVSLTISRTVSTDIPGQPFGVLLDGTDLQGAPIRGRWGQQGSISLVQLPEDSDEDPPVTSTSPLDGVVITSCDVELGEIP